MKVNGDRCHDLLAQVKPMYSFDESKSLEEQRKVLKDKLIELSGLDLIAQNECEPNLDIEIDEQREGYRFIRFTFESERGAVVPCYMLIPKAEAIKCFLRRYEYIC